MSPPFKSTKSALNSIGRWAEGSGGTATPECLVGTGEGGSAITWRRW